jgi:deazaflavin-dependent oxidoreductase (nitroreductase family)
MSELAETNEPMSTGTASLKTRVMRRFWRVANPRAMQLARRTSMVGVLETVGRRSGVPRATPLAIGVDGRTVWIVAAQGESANYVRNIRANPSVTISIRGVRRPGRAEVLPAGTPMPAALGRYARSAALLWPDEWRLVRIYLA